MIKKIGITGGTGLLGKILIKILKKKNIHFSCYKKDIRKIADIKKWLNNNKDINIIFHLAAIVPIKKVNKYKNHSKEVNFQGSKNLYNAINQLNRSVWFFFASTSHVYKAKNKPLKESDKTRPTSFYGVTKLMTEKFLLKNKNKRITICIGRIFSMFHKNQEKPYFYPSMISKFKNKKNISGKLLTLQGGNSLRDFTNAEKIAEIIIKLSKKNSKGIFNIGSGIKITLLEFVKKYININIKINGIGKSDMVVANVLKLKKLSILK
ncbi:SDR family oxidoreductase [Candidatus Pelagibacter sp.]|nr:SDR family oxidoreductase [Candidatus Pelagibacter sp.]